jgi:hypothetical protein
MFKPTDKDPLKNRRSLALLAAFNGFFVFPVLLIASSYYLKTSDALCEDLLHYMGVSVLAPMIGYLYAAHKKDMNRCPTKSSLPSSP